MHRLSEPLRAAGADLPARWVYTWGERQPRSDGMLRLYDSAVLGSRVPIASLVDSLILPAWCTGDDQTERSLGVQLLLANWISFRNGIGHLDTRLPKAWFSSRQSEVWVRATYAALRRCDLADLRFPTVSR
jgi:hypothetical protein